MLNSYRFPRWTKSNRHAVDAYRAESARVWFYCLASNRKYYLKPTSVSRTLYPLQVQISQNCTNNSWSCTVRENMMVAVVLLLWQKTLSTLSSSNVQNRRNAFFLTSSFRCADGNTCKYPRPRLTTDFAWKEEKKKKEAQRKQGLTWIHSPFEQNSTQRTSLPRPDNKMLIYFLSAPSNGNEPATCLSLARNIPCLTFDTIFSFWRSGEWTRDEYHRPVCSVRTSCRVTSLRSRHARYSRCWPDAISKQGNGAAVTTITHTHIEETIESDGTFILRECIWTYTHTRTHRLFSLLQRCDLVSVWSQRRARVQTQKWEKRSQCHESHSPETCCCTLLWAKGRDRAAFSGITDVLLICIFYPCVPFFLICCKWDYIRGIFFFSFPISSRIWVSACTLFFDDPVVHVWDHRTIFSFFFFMNIHFIHVYEYTLYVLSFVFVVRVVVPPKSSYSA